MSEQPAGGFGRMQEEMLARLNELMHSLLEMNPLLQAARRADELPQPVRDLLHGLTGYAGLAVQPLSMFVEYQRDLADQMARWARLQREFTEQMAAWAERYQQFADTMAVLLTPLPEAFRRAAHFLEAHPDDDPHQDLGDQRARERTDEPEPSRSDPGGVGAQPGVAHGNHSPHGTTW